jgi:hypothetical protein
VALRRWRQSPAFFHIRNAPSRTDLDPEERREWAELWQNVEPYLQ